MARLAESRDPESGAHLERVQNYARLLAEDLSRLPTYRETVDENYIRLLYLTSPLHDIGKVAIPDHVLLKPGRLDAAEFEIMKTHMTLVPRPCRRPSASSRTPGSYGWPSRSP